MSTSRNSSGTGATGGLLEGVRRADAVTDQGRGRGRGMPGGHGQETAERGDITDTRR
ncbi:hypothetical protein ACIGD1_26005 [Streptomyces sp. NPDC085612]|uniref:hypothetical protein n=1 Tax=Streptomyces sp. NPDC085612 TaxID=3365732 RepID=UPI0037D761D3